MRRYIGLLLCLVIVCSIFSGCKGSDEGSEYTIYYLNIDGTKLEEYSYDIKADPDSINATIQELLDMLAKTPDGTDYRAPIPSDVKVNRFNYNGYLITVDFNSKYSDIKATDEVLSRAAIVKTLAQVVDNAYVTFTVDGEGLVTKGGSLVGSMNADSFVDNPGEQINSSLQTTLTLYFSNLDGTGLVKVNRTVKYSSKNISLEKLVMEQLIEGPRNSKAISTIPAGTKIINISVVEGVCYVSLDDTFKNNQNNEIMEPIVLYSIVNSLTELPDVSKVQISINGDNSSNVRYNYSLADMYTHDESFVAQDKSEKVDADNTEVNETDKK